jgi:hypothetical protein
MTVLVIITTYILSCFVWPATLQSASLAEGYPTESNLIEGTVVTLSNSTPPQLELANLNNSEYLVGVIENDGQSLLTLNKDGASVLVAISGEVLAFVTDINGDIKPGDFVGSSWINGVGMKAEPVSEQKLVGVALESFTSDSPNTITVDDVETSSGNRSAVVGKIALRLFEREISPDNLEKASALEELAAKLAGKNVSFARVLAAVGLFTTSIVLAGVFLTNAIRSSLISIGRNPLSHEAIFNTLAQIAGVSIGLLLLGAALAYIVLIV